MDITIKISREEALQNNIGDILSLKIKKVMNEMFPKEIFFGKFIKREITSYNTDFLYYVDVDFPTQREWDF